MTIAPAAVSASVTGLAGSGLTLTLDGASPTSIAKTGTFPLGSPLLSGTKYAVAVQSQPTNPSQTCAVTAPGTVIAGAPVTVGVACTTNTYPVGGGPSSSRDQWELQWSNASRSNRRARQPDEWSVRMYNNSDQRADFRVYVVCSTAGSVSGNY